MTLYIHIFCSFVEFNNPLWPMSDESLPWSKEVLEGCNSEAKCIYHSFNVILPLFY